MTEADDPVAELEEMLADDPDDALTAFLLGGAYTKAGRPADAARVFRQAVTNRPDYSAAWAGLGQALDATGDADAAFAAWTEAAAHAARNGDHLVAKQAAAALARPR